MKRLFSLKLGLIIATIILLISSISYGRVYPDLNEATPKPFMMKGLVTIRLEDNVDLNKKMISPAKATFDIPSLDAILTQKNIISSRSIFPFITEKPPVNSGMVDLTRFYELQFPEEQDVQEVINALLEDPNIRMAEPVFAQPLEASPNDTLWYQQWAMEPPQPDPNFYTAWDYETGSDSIKFALIDSGILFRHRDLIDNIWVNPGEDLDGDGVVWDPDDMNGVDDDGNGLVDDVVGYDFFTGGFAIHPNEEPGPPDNDPSDFNGHGTHVAGIVAAANNNYYDVTGIAGGWYGGHQAFRGCRIICCRVGATGDDGRGYVNPNNCATAIAYAVEMGADVINASWGGSSASAAAANNAVAAGVTFCHAAGNDNQDSPDAIDTRPGVLSVASVQEGDAKSGFSNWGSWVDVSAPGSGIRSTYSFSGTPGTASIGGTSMASPMVAGLALLIKSMMPSLSRAEVDSIILATAESDNFYLVNLSYNGLLGSGRIDALAALSSLANAKFTADVTQGQAPLQVQFTDLSPNSPVAWEWSFGNGDVSFDQNPLYTYNEPGIFSVSLKEDENHPLGLGEEHLRNYIWVTDDTLYFGDVDDYLNSDVVVPVYYYNTAPVREIQISFSFANSIGLSYDSISTSGLRTEYFELVSPLALDFFNKRISIRMSTDVSGGSNYLQPGGGVILNIYFSSKNNNGSFSVDTVTIPGSGGTSFPPNIITQYGEYWPGSYDPGLITIDGDQPAEMQPIADQEIDENSLLTFDIFATAAFPISLYTSILPSGAVFTDNGDGNGTFEWTPHFLQNGVYDIWFYADDGSTKDSDLVTITVIDQPCCVGDRGNIDADVLDGVDIDDLVYIVEFSFAVPPGPAPLCPEEADVNSDQSIDIGDIVLLVEYMFSLPPGPPPDSCN